MVTVLRDADRTTVTEAAKKHKVSEPTIYAWRKHFGQMEAAEVKRLKTLEQARAWATQFVRWYNFDHRHSGIRYVSPAQRHAGDDHEILAARHALYARARERNPARWSRDTRNWTPAGAVTLNPERNAAVAVTQRLEGIQPLAA